MIDLTASRRRRYRCAPPPGRADYPRSHEDQASSARLYNSGPARYGCETAVGADWVHEIKHDGYRIIVRRDGPTVRLYSRNAYDWTARLARDRGCC
jgi:hypothetical protein